MNEKIFIYLDEATNGYRLDIVGWHETVRENVDDRLSALRALERKINDMVIEELEHLEAARKPSTVRFDEVING